MTQKYKSKRQTLHSKTVIKTYLINKLIIDSGSAHLGVGEGHVVKFSFSEKVTKILPNLPFGLDIYLVNVQTMRKIVQIFAAFSEKLNFTITHSTHF
mgnify:CR=1 FL=1